jgi:anti-sigma regulatory factor (Ser/Thr protein kinase)
MNTLSARSVAVKRRMGACGIWQVSANILGVVGHQAVGAGSSWDLTMGGLRARLSSGGLLRDGELDLSGVRFVRPGGMVGLSSLVETWTTEDRPLGVRLPPDRVAGYMKRMDVFDAMGDKLVYDRDVTRLEIGARHADASLSELRTVQTEDQVQVVTSEFHRLLSKEGLAKGEVQRCCKVLSEFLENAVVHAESLCGSYTAVQTYRSGGKRVCVAVSDAGVGIPATLRHHPEAVGSGIRTDGDLIRLAAVDGVSRVSDDRGGGFGSALRQVGKGNGVLTAWSGEGWVRFTGYSGARVDEADRFRGTCVEAEFRLG